MEPQNIRFGGGAAETMLHPAVAVSLLIVIALILTQPRQKIITPFLLAFFTIPYTQVIVLGGVHFSVLRILILTVLVRMIAFRTSPSAGKFAGEFDSLGLMVTLWALSVLIVFNLQWMEMQALIKTLGDLIDYLGGYFAARFMIRDRATIRRALQALAVVCVIQGACMVSEQFTAQNVFGFLGANTPTIRDGHVRSEGAILNLYAGAFAGTYMPLFVWLRKEANSRLAAYAGIAGATAMVFASHASTAWMAYGGSLAPLACWFLRKQMRVVRWGMVATLVGLHLVMHGPVWSLIEKIDLTGGSSSFHRYMLVDNCIRHFSDWWLLGCRDYNTWGWEMWDTCNQFVDIALKGGLASLICYVAIFIVSFRAIGIARKQVRGDRRQEWFLWCLGSALFGVVVSSFGINYMIHLMMSLSVLLACISVATFGSRQARVRRGEMPVEKQFAPSFDALAVDSRLYPAIQGGADSHSEACADSRKEGLLSTPSV